MKNLFGSTASEISEREKANAALAREVAREGFVLLKNGTMSSSDSALPLRNKNIALYGAGARKTMKGGTGSGEVSERYSVSIAEGLLNAGYTITTDKWLNDYDRECEESYKAWRDTVEKAVEGVRDIMAGMAIVHTFFYRYPAGRLISDADISASNTDTAIYVVMRQAGEGHDRRLEEGDFFLTGTERANIAKIAAAYKRAILVINVGGFIDLSFLDEISGINAVVFFSQGGMEGGNALADLLSGDFSFSGKLASTWPVKYADIPGGENFSYLNGNLDDEDYAEGIYVGYRYYDSFHVKPRFPFGFGLSYTDFFIAARNISISNTRVTVIAGVKNTGAAYGGKEVVQAYLSCPGGKLKKEYQRLVAFAKTQHLEPNAEQTVELNFDFAAAASYDEASSAWILEAGDYLLRLGNSSRNTRVCAVLALSNAVVIEQCRPCCASERKIPEITPPVGVKETFSEAVPRLVIDPAAFVVRQHDYTEGGITETPEEKRLLDGLSPADMAELLRGGDVRKNTKDTHAILKAAGKTAITLIDKGIANVVFCDGPAGINVMERVKHCPDGEQRAAYIPERFNFGAFGQAMRHMVSAEGDDIYRYATAWPASILLAQTWNTGLIEKAGNATAEEMLEFGITLWLAPGMNIHRNPLCGRNFEYYSEDPFLSGIMAAAITKGVQNHEGVGTTIKHFACNNQEDNRTGVSSNVNERALREIYLKGFEIAVKKSNPMALMTSYNRLNKIYTANSRDLCIDILRREWGYNGLVMTDWGSCDPGQGKPELCAPAGNDLVMPGTEKDKQEILNAVKNGSISTEILRRSACRVLRVILQSRISHENEKPSQSERSNV
jgi:beta-glucosidase